MLKPGEHLQAPPPERPVGELVHQLLEEGKAYAKAEVGLVKAIATSKGKALALPAGLLGAALLVAQAAITILAVGVFAMLQWVVGTILAGFLTFLIFAAIAGALVWYALKRLREDL
jgi:hypothetical protein